MNIFLSACKGIEFLPTFYFNFSALIKIIFGVQVEPVSGVYQMSKSTWPSWSKALSLSLSLSGVAGSNPVVDRKLFSLVHCTRFELVERSAFNRVVKGSIPLVDKRLLGSSFLKKPRGCAKLEFITDVSDDYWGCIYYLIKRGI